MKNIWSFLIVSNQYAPSSGRRVGLPRIVIVMCALVALSGLVGLGRCIYVSSTFIIAKYGVYKETNANENLIKKVAFFKKKTVEESKKLTVLINFEDKARLKYGMNTIAGDIRLAGVGGVPDPVKSIFSALEDPLVRGIDSMQEHISQLIRQAQLQETTFFELQEQAKNQNDRWLQRPSIWPLGKRDGRITSGFGYRSDPFYSNVAFHEGLDIAQNPGTSVYATANGVIIGVERSSDGYGNMVTISHGTSAYKTIFGHLQSKIAVTYGQKIKRGDLIGYIGNSGRSTGPHLHYEVRSLGRPLNPSGFILSDREIID